MCSLWDPLKLASKIRWELDPLGLSRITHASGILLSFIGITPGLYSISLSYRQQHLVINTKEMVIHPGEHSLSRQLSSPKHFPLHLMNGYLIIVNRHTTLLSIPPSSRICHRSYLCVHLVFSVPSFESGWTLSHVWMPQGRLMPLPMYAMRKGPVYARTMETTGCAGYKLPEAALVPPLVSSLPFFPLSNWTRLL